MNRFTFKTEDFFLKWNEDWGNFVTAIYYENNYVCDVLQKDYLYLQSIGFIDEGVTIIPKLDKEHLTMFKHNWGVEIVILYDEICKLLTWYEHRDECPYDDDELFEKMYDILVDLQEVING